jgi:hypothetical protein
MKEPDTTHLKWLVEKRSDIQRTLLVLYEYVRSDQPRDPVAVRILDHLIAAAFSLWRAVFLAETDRDWQSVFESQRAFLASVVTDNAITYQDDKRNRAWTVGYYLENAKLRLGAAHQIANAHSKYIPPKVPELLRLTGSEPVLTRYEWESVHSALCLVINALSPGLISIPAINAR